MRTVYKHTVVVGIDGMGTFNRFCNTPNMDRIFENHAKTYKALSMDHINEDKIIKLKNNTSAFFNKILCFFTNTNPFTILL